MDLATYESTLPFTEGDNEKNVIGRCQLTTDSGKKCGSGYVDDRMESLLIEILLHDADDVPMENKKAFVAPLMVQFIDDYKVHTWIEAWCTFKHTSNVYPFIFSLILMFIARMKVVMTNILMVDIMMKKNMMMKII